MMSFSLRRQSGNSGAERKRRKHHIVPFLENPLTGADEEEAVFCQRHESSSIELFFDLFFVANLATFTAYHSINDRKSLTGYIGFFAIIWTTWFQITLHDVRFARDSIYERACKTVQFIVFVGFALVGYSFEPGEDKNNNTNFRVLCYMLLMSRILLTFQYLVVLLCTISKKGYKKLYLPLSLNVLVYFVSAVVFGSMVHAFPNDKPTHPRMYSVWYIMLLLEGAGNLAISSFWRMLSFKKTHLVERMSLLTMIVIGEGAIGITKTVGRTMGKSGPNFEGCMLVMCIIFILVFLWVLYFDNHPRSHYGTIRQQVWAVLHFPLQLAIVGIVEGSQQIALARYVMKQATKLDKEIYKYCMEQHLDGTALVAALVKSLEYFKLNTKAESDRWVPMLNEDLWNVGNSTGICSRKNTVGQYEAGFYPDALLGLFFRSMGAIYASLGVKLPSDESPFELAIASWKIVYIYYWASLTVLFLCLITFLWIIRRNKADVFDYVSIITRGLGVVIAVGLLGIAANDDLLYTFIETPSILPTVVALLFAIIFFDMLTKRLSNYRLKSKNLPYDDHHKHHHGHQERKRDAAVVSEEAILSPDLQPSQTTSSYSSGTVYNPVPQIFSAQPYGALHPSPGLSPMPSPMYGGAASPQYMPLQQQTNGY